MFIFASDAKFDLKGQIAERKWRYPKRFARSKF